MTERELRTWDQDETHRCTEGGVTHDFRPHTRDEAGGRWQHTYWRCVWCHGVTCGNYGDPDPCWEIYHHRTDHRTRKGITWPIGGARQEADGLEVTR